MEWKETIGEMSVILDGINRFQVFGVWLEVWEIFARIKEWKWNCSFKWTEGRDASESICKSKLTEEAKESREKILIFWRNPLDIDVSLYELKRAIAKVKETRFVILW